MAQSHYVPWLRNVCIKTAVIEYNFQTKRCKIRIMYTKSIFLRSILCEPAFCLEEHSGKYNSSFFTFNIIETRTAQLKHKFSEVWCCKTFLTLHQPICVRQQFPAVFYLPLISSSFNCTKWCYCHGVHFECLIKSRMQSSKLLDVWLASLKSHLEVARVEFSWNFLIRWQSVKNMVSATSVTRDANF